MSAAQVRASSVPLSVSPPSTNQFPWLFPTKTLTPPIRFPHNNLKQVVKCPKRISSARGASEKPEKRPLTPGFSLNHTPSADRANEPAYALSRKRLKNNTIATMPFQPVNGYTEGVSVRTRYVLAGMAI
jgi:hypothetical protein